MTTNFNVFKVIHYILNVDFSPQGVYKDCNYLIQLFEPFGNMYQIYLECLYRIKFFMEKYS